MEQHDDDPNMNQLLNSISSNFGDYVVKAPIGRGAGSFVVQVQSRKSQRDYAVKVIDKKGPTYKNIQKRLLNEIEIHKQLKHKNIIKLINVFEDPDNHYLMLELCSNGDLYNYLKSKGRLDEDEAREISYSLAIGLNHLHENKIIHRDLKLGNILLTQDLKVKICDFGLAIKLQDFEQERNTLCGTPNYISPEIINREPYGIKIDCWSFGCILYALITGKPPFESLSVQETLKKVKTEQYLDLPQNISAELKDLLKNIINWNRETRFDIQQILQHPFYEKCHKQQQSDQQKSIPNLVQKSQNIIQKHIRNINNVQDQQIQLKKQSVNLKETHNFLNVVPQTQPDEKRKDEKSSSQTNFYFVQKKKKQVNKLKKQVTSQEEELKQFFIQNKENIIFSQGVSPERQIYENEQGNLKNSIGLNLKYRQLNKRSPMQGIKTQQNENISPGMFQRNGKVNNKIQGNNAEIKRSPGLYLRYEKNLPNKQQSRLKTNESQEESKINQKFSYYNDLSHNTSGERNICDNFISARDMLSTSKSFNNTDNEFANILKLSPLKIGNISENSFETKNGVIQILKNKTVKISACNGKMSFHISQDGETIKILKDMESQQQIKQYSLQQLPRKYHDLYSYAKKVCEILKSKMIKLTMEDENGKFILMENDSFEAKYKNGFRCSLKHNSNMMKIKTTTGMTFELNIDQNLNNVNEEIVNIVRQTLFYVKKMKK